MLAAAPVTSVAEIADLRLRRLYEYWQTKRGDCVAPLRADINPVEIPDLLGFVNIYDVQEDPRDFRVRLNGTEVSEMLGRDITGKLCSQITSGEDAQRCKAGFNKCIDDRIPVLVETSLAFCGKPYGAQTILALPLSSDGNRVDMMITAHFYQALAESSEAVSKTASL